MRGKKLCEPSARSQKFGVNCQYQKKTTKGYHKSLYLRVESSGNHRLHSKKILV